MDKLKSEYQKDAYIAELVSLWASVVREVYLKEPLHAQRVAEDAWHGTNMTPLRYVETFADPKHLTNRIQRGQKAREKRWTRWINKILEG